MSEEGESVMPSQESKEDEISGLVDSSMADEIHNARENNEYDESERGSALISQSREPGNQEEDGFGLTQSQFAGSEMRSVDQRDEDEEQEAEDQAFEEALLANAKDEIEITPSNACIEWLKSKLDLDGFTPEKWRNDYNEIVNEFLNEEGTSKIYFWMDEELGLMVKNLEPPKLSKDDSGFIFFIKPYDAETITPDNITANIRWGLMDRPLLDSLLEHMNSYFVPTVKKETKWPESVKKEFLGQLHRFMSVLTETSFTMKGTTMLYIPNEDITDPEAASKDKDLVQRLESTLIHWTKQIRDVVNEHDLQRENENAGPLDEIHHWKLRTVNLSRINDQLSKPELQKVIKVLKQADSSYLKRFNELAGQIERGAQEADDNLKHLQTIDEPCRKLGTSRPSEIPVIIPTLLDKVKTIWENSKYYSSSERITGLLRKISNEIINRCIAIIDINDMLGNNVLKCMADLEESKKCGEAWKVVFEKTAEKIEQQGGKPWTFNKGSIFSQLEAFVQTCVDLNHICEGQLQFARKGASSQELPHFGGTRGREIKENIQEIERSFSKQVERIKTLGYNILDVKNTRWHGDFNKFKLKMKHLENMFKNIIDFAFQGVTTVQQGCEMLEAFDSLAQRQSIRQHIQKKAIDVYEKFRADLDLVKKEYDNRRDPPLASYHPKFGGTALWITSLITRINKQKAKLDQLTFICDDAAIRKREEVFKKHEKTLENLKTYVNQTLYNEWKQEVEEMSSEGLSKRMKRPVFNKGGESGDAFVPGIDSTLLKKTKYGSLDSDFDKGLMKLVAEVKCWEKLQSHSILIPSEWHEVANFREEFRIIKENVLLVVRDYNNVMSVLNDDEKRLFDFHINYLNKKLEPGWKKNIDWNNKAIVETTIRDWKKQCTDCLDKVLKYKNNMDRLEAKSNEISEIQLLSLNRKQVYESEEFEDQQKEHLNRIRPKISTLCDEMMSIIMDTYEIFNPQTELKFQWAKSAQETVTQQWQKTLQEIDRRLEESLKRAVRAALSDLNRAINGDNKNEPNPVYRLHVTLDEQQQQTDFRPRREELKSMIYRVLNSVVQITTFFTKLEDRFYDEQAKLAPKADKLTANPMLANALSSSMQPLKKPEEEAKQEDDASVVRSSNIKSFERDEEIQQVMKRISRGIDKCNHHLDDQLKTWMQEQFRSVWQSSKAPFLKRMKARKPDAPSFEESIKHYHKIIGEVSNERNSVNVLFVLIDNTEIQNILKRFCMDWINSITDLVNEMAKEELYSLHELFDKSTKELSINPVDIYHLKRSRDRLRELEGKVYEIQNEIVSTQKKYEFLHDNDVQYSSDEVTKLTELDERFGHWKEMLQTADVRLERSAKEFEKEVNKSWKDYEKAVEENQNEFRVHAPFNVDGSDNHRAKKAIQEFRYKVAGLKEREETMQFGVKLFDISAYTPAAIGDIERELDLLDDIWDLKARWDDQWESWKNTRFYDLNVEIMTEIGKEYIEKLKELEKNIKNWGVWTHMTGNLNVFLNTLPLIKQLGHKSIKDRHWREIREEVKQQFNEKSPDFTLETLFSLNLHQYYEFIEDLFIRAQQQHAIEDTIGQIQGTWEGLELDIAVYKESYLKLQSTDLIFQALEENIVSLSSMKSQIHAEPFMEDIARWEDTLSSINETIEILLQVQRQWVYLESIFVGQEDIRKQLPSEYSTFMKVNDRFMEEMKRIDENPNGLKALCYPGFFDTLNDLNLNLDIVQKSLNQFLEKQRQKFPRFYFLSNDDLLAILGQSRNPQEIQVHIKKLFEGIKRLEMTETIRKQEGGGTRGMKINEISALFAGDGEKVQLTQKIIAEGAVEHWLDQLEKGMQLALKKRLVECYKNTANKDKKSWVQSFQGQLLITAGQIKWTQDTKANLIKSQTDSDKKNPLKEQLKLQRRYIKRLVDMVKQPLDAMVRNRLVALITIEQHAREVISRLIDKSVSNPNDFEWMMQLRFDKDERPEFDYWICMVNQTSTSFEYGYEYQGNNGRLVVTPLTDRCYMTLTTALHLKRGGAPQGPAGTGKTETVKDLGKNMAKFVIVINCSESMDFSSLGRLFSGFAQSGAWGCLDEFNRIEVEVLSVIAQQISKIQFAIKENRKQFNFEGATIKLNPTCGVFVTMNPGYAGRSELPDNLKSLFRPISMMAADLQLIAEIMLLSEGFDEGGPLSKKTVTLYSLMIQQLSKQDHYDFGMRALKSVLTCAGSLKREQPQGEEKVLLMKALYDMNIPKLVTEDVSLFNALLYGIFAGIELPESENDTLRNAIKAELESNNLQSTDMIVNKCIQLYDSKRIRHGNMIVGQALSGKSTVWKTLQKSMSSLAKGGTPGFENVRTTILNPKSITLNELYGFYDSAGEWHDGILSSVMRQICSDETNEYKWFILDGPVDTKWIENMNSVLDDSKLLTLNNGDRIAIPSNVRLVFEVENLAVASPATVSRAGMVYLDVNEHGYWPYLTSWMQSKKEPETIQFLKEMFNKYVPKVLEVKRLNCKEPVTCMPINAIISLTHVFDSFATGADLDKNDDAYWMFMEKWFVFSVIWSIGATVDEAGRDTLDNCIREIETGFPHSGLVYDYFVNIEKKDWASWSDKLSAKPTIIPNTPFHKILIPTVDTYRNLEIMKQLVKNGHFVLTVGQTGTGKTALINTGLLSTLDDNFCHFNINFSGQTSAGKTQDIIENNLEKRTSNKRGPPGNKTCLMFVDDLNMPRKEEFGSQPPLELLRQWADYGYWWDRQKQAPLYIFDLKMISAMGLPGGGRAEISQRMQCHFNLLNFTLPDEGQMRRIYYTIISHHLQDFEEEVKPLAESFTQATISLYRRVTEMFLPTPTKSHYVFNMRDISKVFQGMYRADKSFHDSKESLVKLWVHECLRIFHDRLINAEDQATFKNLLEEQLQSGMSMSYAQCCQVIKDGENEVLIDPLFVDGDLRVDGVSVYDLVDDREKLKNTLTDKLEEYNSQPRNIEMNLVLFKEAINYLCRIHRILKQSQGHALLVGVGGSGRHSLTKLGAFLSRYSLIQLEINKNYRLQEFRDDIKKMKWKAGIENTPLVFIFSDNDVVNELFLEDVNNLLSAGEVPNIYTSDELRDIREAIKKDAKEEKKPETPDGLFNFFIDRVRKNLHVCFCISPIGDQFRNYCRVYPGLINNTTINWFMPWPEDALFEVAKKFTHEKLDFKESLKLSIAEIFCKMHVNVTDSTRRMLRELKRVYHVTPTHYLDLVQGYLKLLQNKQKEIGDNASKLRTGLGKLEDAKIQVEKMSKELEETKSEVSKKQKACEDLLIQINQEQAKAEKSQKEVEHKAEEIEKEKKGVEAIASEADADLQKALPALLEAEAALEKLDKSEISEVKSYANPPKPVETVMEAVMVIISKEKPTWANAKKELNDPAFMTTIRTFPKENIPNKTLRKLETYTRRPDFNPQVVENISRAAAALCQWVHAMEAFAKTYRDVEPKRQNVNALRSNLEKMEEKLTELMNQLKELTDTIQNLDAMLKKQEADKLEYEKSAKELSIKLERAEKLVSGLASERLRWESSLLALEEKFTKLPGDCLISAAFLSYNGPFTSEYRDHLIEELWLPLVRKKQIPLSPDYSFTGFMAKPTEVREWNLQKLPTDKFSVENGILTVRNERWPLCIDPQSQANTWIKKMEEGKLRVVNPQQRYMNVLEEAVKLGLPVLMEDVGEDIDPSLDPILRKSIQKRGKTYAIKIGEKELAYNFNFRIYLTTRMGNPNYTPEICTKVCLINFQVKQSGLEEQLLGIVVRKEDSKLEDDKDKLVVSIAEDNKTLVDLEDKILSLLTNSKTSLLDDEKLIVVLQSSKDTAESVKQQIEVAESTMRKIDGMRENYRPCATRASVIFFVLAGLANIDPMYQFSLESYIELFKDSIDKSKEKFPVWDSIPERIGHLDKYHVNTVYVSTCRALFEKHKMLLSLQMCVELNKLTGSIDLQEYSFFLTGAVLIGAPAEGEERTPNPDPEWLTQEMWDNITELERTIPTFQGIEGSMIVSRKEWKRWFQTSEPENEHLPGEWDAKADDMRKMVLLRCLRPDRVIFAVSDFVAKMLGPEYIEAPPFNLEEIYTNYSKATQPLLFVLHPGVDPAPSLQLLAQEKGKDLEVIPLGKGQDTKANKALTDACEKGYWVFLANCHLAISWMPRLEEYIETLARSATPHEDFRLWLSSDPHPKFPISILQRSIKMTTEPPKGLRANMLRLYNQITERHYTRVEKLALPKYKKLIFSLCWFHSIMVERKKFKDLGWNVVYSFNDSDFEVSENIISKYLGYKEEDEKMEVDINNIPWDALRYLIADVSYGGRVTDERDRRLLSVYAEECFNPKVIEESKYKLHDNSQVYYIPDDSNYKAPPDMTNPAHFYVKFIKTFPQLEKPEAFGQHVNAQIASQIGDTKELLDALVSLQPATAAIEGDSMEDKVYHICTDLLEKIPEPLKLDDIKKRWERDSSYLKVVLLQEIARFNLLLRYTRNSLIELQKGIKGLVVISSELEKILKSLYINKVPETWQFAYPSLKPLASWVRDLAARIKQLRDWAYGQPPIVFWISGFTYPTGFTTALLQTVAYSKQISIDSLSMDHIIIPSEESALIAQPKEGAYIKGLFLEGAKWNSEESCLCEPEPMELSWPMPIIHFKPIKDKKKNKGSVYSCPCYYYSVRTGTGQRPSFMFYVDLKCGETKADFWVKRGAALLMQLDI
jgi:dynein heavy chain